MDEERDAADEVIRRFHFEPLRSETYSAIGLSSEQICLKMAEECDIFLGIYGYRNGTVPSDLKVSVTDMEYLKAKGVDPGEILIYVKNIERGTRVDARQRQFRRQVE